MDIMDKYKILRSISNALDLQLLATGKDNHVYLKNGKVIKVCPTDTKEASMMNHIRSMLPINDISTFRLRNDFGDTGIIIMDKMVPFGLYDGDGDGDRDRYQALNKTLKRIEMLDVSQSVESYINKLNDIILEHKIPERKHDIPENDCDRISVKNIMDIGIFRKELFDTYEINLKDINLCNLGHYEGDDTFHILDFGDYAFEGQLDEVPEITLEDLELQISKTHEMIMT